MGVGVGRVVSEPPWVAVPRISRQEVTHSESKVTATPQSARFGALCVMGWTLKNN